MITFDEHLLELYLLNKKINFEYQSWTNYKKFMMVI